MMSRARGLLLGGVAVVVLEALTGLLGVVMLGPVEIAFYLLACAAATAAATSLAAWLIRPRRGGDEDDDDGGGDGDGGPPPWWPEFERDFWRYASGRSALQRGGYARRLRSGRPGKSSTPAAELPATGQREAEAA